MAEYPKLKSEWSTSDYKTWNTDETEQRFYGDCWEWIDYDLLQRNRRALAYEESISSEESTSSEIISSSVTTEDSRGEGSEPEFVENKSQNEINAQKGVIDIDAIFDNNNFINHEFEKRKKSLLLPFIDYENPKAYLLTKDH